MTLQRMARLPRLLVVDVTAHFRRVRRCVQVKGHGDLVGVGIPDAMEAQL